MRTRIQQWDDSLAVPIPEALAAGARLARGALVEVSLVNGKLVVEPVDEAAFTLEGLLAGVTEQNLHREVETGEAIGAEVW